MCDFHSVIVTNEGKILHHPSNSHSQTAAHFGLPTGLDATWFECEWDGIGLQPIQLIQLRGKTTTPSYLAERAAEHHYNKLAAIMSVDADENTVFPAPFDAPEYEDVRRKAMSAKIERERRAAEESAAAIKRAQLAEAEAEAEAVAEKFDSAFIGFNHEQEIAFIRHLLENSSLSVELSDVAETEIEAAREAGYEDGQEAGYESGQQSGYESASEDMYTPDYTQELIDEAVKEAREECRSEDSDEYQTAYEAGFLACKTGASPTVTHINGLPSFLFA
jgi:hypothetical protein